MCYMSDFKRQLIIPSVKCDNGCQLIYRPHGQLWTSKSDTAKIEFNDMWGMLCICQLDWAVIKGSIEAYGAYTSTDCRNFIIAHGKISKDCICIWFCFSINEEKNSLRLKEYRKLICECLPDIQCHCQFGMRFNTNFNAQKKKKDF